MRLAHWIAVGSAFGFAGAADAQRFTFSAGAEYSVGDYGGGADTEVLYAPITAGLMAGNWNVRATLPYLNISGPGFFLGEEFAIATDRDAPIRDISGSASGLGDLRIAVTKSADLDETGSWTIDLNARIKLPTAENVNGLGTGEADYSASVDIIHSMDAWSWFAGGGYRVNGDPADRNFNDIAFASVGAVLSSEGRPSWGLAYDFSQSPTDGVDNSHELSTWTSFGVSDSARLQLYGLVGLADGGPDYGAGARLAFTY